MENIQVICGRVEETMADAIVNSTNMQLRCDDYGVSADIFRRASRLTLQVACDEVAPCPVGGVRITPAFGIRTAKRILHTVVPHWQGGGAGERELLAKCYRNIFKVADGFCCKSVAIPCLGTGQSSFPMAVAAEIAMREAVAFTAAHPDFRVVFASWDGIPGKGEAMRQIYQQKLTAFAPVCRRAEVERQRTPFWERVADVALAVIGFVVEVLVQTAVLLFYALCWIGSIVLGILAIMAVRDGVQWFLGTGRHGRDD